MYNHIREVQEEIKELTNKTVKTKGQAEKAISSFFFPSKEEFAKVSDSVGLEMLACSGGSDNGEGLFQWLELYKVSENVAYLVTAYDGGNTNDALILKGNVSTITTLFEAYFN